MARRSSVKAKPTKPEKKTAPLPPEPEPEIWLPKLFGKQWDVFNSRKRILLVCGSRKASKTWACTHRICRHLWETPGARIGFFSKSVKLAKDGGVWQDLLEIALPEWTESGIGFELTTFDSSGVPGPKQDAQTRTAYFRVRNMHGGESECKLFSIEHDQEVASKVKGKRFSMIFFSELSMFKDKRILTITLPSLRMPHLTPPEGQPDIWHQWMADTNPDEELGDKSWFYKVWYKDRVDPDFKYKNFQSNLGLIEMFLPDNPFVTKEEIEELEASCDGDDCLFDSYVRGVHGEGASKRDRFFVGYFDKNVHVVGDTEEEGDQIDVHDTSDLLMTGSDLGLTCHAAAIIEPWYRPIGDRILPCFSALDELELVDEKISLDEFTHLLMEKMAALQDRWKKKFKWKHWTDDQALTTWRPSSSSYDYMEINAASKLYGPQLNLPEIILEGVEKPWGSIAARVRIIRMLLRQHRFWVSARCVRIIAMLENLRKGDSEREYVLRDQHKHMFDALTYPIFMTIVDELSELTKPRTSRDVNPVPDYVGID